MIHHRVPQNTPEWLQLRLSIPTASCFGRIVTPKTGKLSESHEGYLNTLLAEFIIGAPLDDDVQTQWMVRGQELEDQGISAAEFLLEIETEPGGFFTTDDGLIGASPDRIHANGKRGVEVKAPSAAVHVGYMRGGRSAIDSAYRCQLAGEIFVCEFEGVDVISFHPRLPTVHIAVEREGIMGEFVDKLGIAVREFSDRLEAAKIELVQRFGPFVRPERSAEEAPIDTGLNDELVDAVWARALKQYGRGEQG